MLKLALILVLSVGSTYAQGCWWTGCQPNSWAVTGCGQYDLEEKGREQCQEGGAVGNKYQCCPKEGSDDKGFVDLDQFSSAVTSNGYPAPSTEQYNNFNNYVRSQANISSVQEAAMCLAQLLHESDGLRAKREYACEHTNCPDSYRYPGCDAANQYYYGRGYIQLSWCYNYRAASLAIFGDDRLVTDADSVARDDSIAWRTAFWYWSAHVHNAPGVEQGQFGATTKAINGALECSSPGHPAAKSRYRIYGKVRAAFGLTGAGDPAGCAGDQIGTTPNPTGTTPNSTGTTQIPTVTTQIPTVTTQIPTGTTQNSTRTTGHPTTPDDSSSGQTRNLLSLETFLKFAFVMNFILYNVGICG